jgi:hypothetical protein
MATHGGMAGDYITDRLSDVLGDLIKIEDWLRIAAAVDAINEAANHRPN